MSERIRPWHAATGTLELKDFAPHGGCFRSAGVGRFLRWTIAGFGFAAGEMINAPVVSRCVRNFCIWKEDCVARESGGREF